MFSRKFGHRPLQTLWDTRKVVTGLESLADSHFPRNYVSADVRVGKSTVADQPSPTATVPSRPNEVWHMDTIGPTKTTSLHGYRYNTSFTCGYTGYVLSYGHASPSQVQEIQERWYADIARFTVFGKSMANIVYSAVMMPLLMFSAEQPLFMYLRVFAQRPFVPPKVTRTVLPNA